MRRKFEVSLSPTEMAELARVASALGISRTEAVRFLVHREHGAVATRGETEANVDATKRGE